MARDVPSIKYIDTNRAAPMDKRIDPRVKAGEAATICGFNGNSLEARLENINHDGCYLTIPGGIPPAYDAGGENRLHVAGEFVLDMILLPSGDGYRGLFMKNDFAAFENLCSFVNRKAAKSA